MGSLIERQGDDSLVQGWVLVASSQLFPYLGMVDDFLGRVLEEWTRLYSKYGIANQSTRYTMGYSNDDCALAPDGRPYSSL